MERSSTRLPVTHDLKLAAITSYVVAALMATVSAVGLVFGTSDLYGDDDKIVQWFRGWDAANLVVGLPILLWPLWLARRGSLVGLLLWPGALYYLLYSYALYLIGAPFNALFLVYVALVTLSAYTTIGIVASIDDAEMQRRLAHVPARAIGGTLVGVGVLATLALTVPVITTLTGSTPVDPLLHAEWIVDFAIGNPVLLLGGVLLWRRERIGFVAAAGLLFLSGANGIAFAASGVLGALLAAAPIDMAVIAVHLGIAVVCFAVLMVFLRGLAPGSVVEPKSVLMKRETVGTTEPHPARSMMIAQAAADHRRMTVPSDHFPSRARRGTSTGSEDPYDNFDARNTTT